MTPVGGIMVTVTLFAVAVTAVFGADDVCFLKRRAGKRVRAREVKRGRGRGRKEEEE